MSYQRQRYSGFLPERQRYGYQAPQQAGLQESTPPAQDFGSNSSIASQVGPGVGTPIPGVGTPIPAVGTPIPSVGTPITGVGGTWVPGAPRYGYGADLSGLSKEDKAAADADRAAASQELLGQFEIVADDFSGPRKPNQISQEEFDEVSALYSDIRQGRTNFEFDPGDSGMSDEDFLSGAMGDFRDILTTKQGRDLLGEVAYDRKNTTPLTIGGLRPDVFGAYAGISPGGNTFDATDGTGTVATAMYHPGEDLNFQQDTATNDGWADMTSDTILYHELVHAYHLRNGTYEGTVNQVDESKLQPFQLRPGENLTPADAGQNVEEYATIGLGAHERHFSENSYRNEREVVTGSAIDQRDSYLGSGT